ncbi:MAG TPA: hypothetical protein VLE22_05580 [Bryobacteraceae bacterium]|nr:hypothetical protein [Bryobacteraceae bacterium]
MTGGTVTAGPVSQTDPVLSFSNARAEIKGWFDSASNTYITENWVRVESLDVEDWLHADRVEVKLTFKFQKSSEQLTADLVTVYSELRVDNAPIASAPPNTLPVHDAENHAQFRNHLAADPGAIGLSGKFKIKKSKAHASLAQNPGLSFVDPNFGFKDSTLHPGRRVYLSEWAEDEDWQGIVGLRAVFLDPQGNLQRQIVVADWLGNNGQFYP